MVIRILNPLPHQSKLHINQTIATIIANPDIQRINTVNA
jgi:hypothetical protein